MSLRDFYAELDQRMARPDEDWEAYILRVQACAAQVGVGAFSEASLARTNVCVTGDVGEVGNGDVWRAEAALNGRQDGVTDNARRTAEAKKRERRFIEFHEFSCAAEYSHCFSPMYDSIERGLYVLFSPLRVHERAYLTRTR